MALAPVASGLRADEPPRAAKSELNGVWVAEKVTSAGNVVPSEKFPFEVVIEDDKLIFKFVGSVAGKDRIHQIVVDNTKDPYTIDMTREVRGKKETVRGIYKIEDGRLLICSLRDGKGQPSSERPKTFESSSSVKSDLLILKPKLKEQP